MLARVKHELFRRREIGSVFTPVQAAPIHSFIEGKRERAAQDWLAEECRKVWAKELRDDASRGR